MRSLRRSSVLGFIAILTCALGGATFASPAMAEKHEACSPYDMCAYANADFGGSYLLFPDDAGGYVANYTEVGGANQEGCTHTDFNDCVSSQKNDGPYGGFYYWNAYCSGEAYTNTANTYAEFVGTYWNDEFSSQSEYDDYASC
jgi:hypothetical protein